MFPPIQTRKLAILFALVLFLSGCHHAPLTYQLQHSGSTTILIPPSLNPATASSDISITIKNARKRASSNNSCDVENALITLHWRGSTAEVNLKSEAYYTNAANQNPHQTAPGMYLDPLRNMESFRADLRKLEWNGCLRPGEAQALLQIITEKLPFPTYIAFLFRFGSFDSTGILDLTPDFRLQIGSPIYSPGAAPTPDHLIGHENASYVFNPAQKSNRIQMSLASATETLARKSPVAKSTSQTGLEFPESFGYFRLLFRTRTDATSQASIATILFTQDASKLDEATRQSESGSLDSCGSVSVPGVNCISIPTKFGVAPEMRVRANGQDDFIRVGGSISDALDAHDPRATVNINSIVKSLHVRRLYQGHLIHIQFDPSTRDILSLVLMPGDELTWH